MINITRYVGRKRIELECSKQDFLSDVEGYLKSFMGKATSIHYKNRKEIEFIDNELRGEQAIYTKNRTDGNEINNKFTENHTFRMWKFKTSYTVGSPIQYSNKKGNNDDMTYFNRYLQDCQKHNHDIDVYGDVYEYGVGYRMILPKINNYDAEWESPVRDIYLDPRDTFVAYSASYDKEELFSCIIDRTKDIKRNKVYTRYTIYYTDENDDCWSIRLNDKYLVDTNGEKQKEAYKYNPIIEYTLPKRMGIVEIASSLQNALNYIDSLQIDDIEQFIQAYIVFINQDIDLDTDEGRKAWETQLSLFQKTRAMVLKSINEQMPADFKLVSNSLDHSSINNLHDRLETAMYNIVGCPKSSGSVTSGGDTTGARLLGNGWESALNDSKLETTFYKNAEYKWLKFFVIECKSNKNNKLNNVLPSEIEIKYNINMSDNILVKSQAIVNLKTANMPNEMILTAVPIISDTYGGAKNWSEHEEKIKKEEQQNELKISQQKKVTNEDINDLNNKANA